MKKLISSILYFVLIQPLLLGAGCDTDGDGYCDFLEAEWGSDPGDPSSIPFFFYGTQQAPYLINEPIENILAFVPTGTSGFEISPALPAGLVFNTSNGTISGTPTAPTPQKFYNVTARNPSTPQIFMGLFIEVVVPPEIVPSPQITSAVFDRSANQIEFVWASNPGEEFLIQSSTDLVNWREVGDPISAGNNSSTSQAVSITTETPGTYYRLVRVTD